VPREQGNMARKRLVFAWVLISVSCIGTGCQNQRQTEQAQPRENSAQTMPTEQPQGTTALPDQWLGRWTGPEGTFIELSKNGNKYVVKINSLDGPATYEGIAVGDRIEFQRDGKTESIHAGNGEDTGMKWLLDEKNCLVIKKSEGFCRKN
jgi:hypothetical protein